MNLKTLGEFNFIDQIKGKALLKPENVIKGIDDDCAVYQTDRNRVSVVTTDTLTEGVHFLREKFNPYELGIKALSISLSDIAAMGARPSHALLNIAVPPDTELDYLEAIYSGFYDMALIYNINLIGGDTTASLRDIMIVTTVIGDVSRRRVIYRNQAQPGDRIFVTDTLGNSAAGLKILQDEIRLENVNVQERLLKSHTQPKAYIFEGEFIAESGCATAMIDVSDGLSSDLNHIIRQSEVSAQIYIDKLPVSEELRQFCDETGEDLTDLILHGGEDYCLLFTVKPQQVDLFEASYRHRFSGRLTEIGEIVEGYGMTLIDEEGNRSELEPGGWDHFMP